MKVLVVGGGLAGCEAAYQLAEAKIDVVLIESKRVMPNLAWKTEFLAELICSNSLKSTKPDSAASILKNELKCLNSLILKTAYDYSVPAGHALAVDRESFSRKITEIITNHSHVTLIDKIVRDPVIEAADYGCDKVIIASGPLTNDDLANWIKNISSENLYFYDAIAPIIDAASIDFSKLYYKDRYQDDGDYLNIPLNKEEYSNFCNEIKKAVKVRPKVFEEAKFFEACMPIDVLVDRGNDTLRFGPLKPIGLDFMGKTPHAVIQLRKENTSSSAFGMVGCQNRLTYSEQMRIFKTLPGLENAKFLQLGSVHRNTFIHSHDILTDNLCLKSDNNIYFAGQITGVEGYLESTAIGLYVARKLINNNSSFKGTAIYALVDYLMRDVKGIPTNMNFGLFSISGKDKAKKISDKSNAALASL